MTSTMARNTIFYVVLTIMAILLFFPVVYGLSASLMSSQELMVGKFIPSKLQFSNYATAMANVPLLKFMVNSLIVSTTVMIGQLLVCSLAAFAIVFIDFKGRNLVFSLLISTMMIPWEATIIPNYLTILNLKWLNTYYGLAVPHIAIAFGVFLLRQHFLTLPKELYESAQIEGCSRFRFFLTFVLPLSRSMLSALGVYGFLTTWNMYLWPLLTTTNNSVRTVQIGIKMMQAQETSTNWPVVMAGVMIVLIPTLLFLFLGMKQLKRGLMAGALKG